MIDEKRGSRRCSCKSSVILWLHMTTGCHLDLMIPFRRRLMSEDGVNFFVYGGRHKKY